MNRRRKNRLVTIMALLLAAGGTLLLVLYALRANIDLFYTPGEIVYGRGEDALRPEPGRSLRVGGMVMAGSLRRASDSLGATFILYDARGKVAVSYDGILPDLFREGQAAVVKGVLEQGGQVRASEVLAKHDENYLPPEVKSAMAQQGPHAEETQR